MKWKIYLVMPVFCHTINPDNVAKGWLRAIAKAFLSGLPGVEDHEEMLALQMK